MRCLYLAPGTWEQALVAVLGASPGRHDHDHGHPAIEIAIYPDVVWLATRSLRETSANRRPAS